MCANINFFYLGNFFLLFSLKMYIRSHSFALVCVWESVCSFVCLNFPAKFRRRAHTQYTSSTVLCFFVTRCDAVSCVYDTHFIASICSQCNACYNSFSSFFLYTHYVYIYVCECMCYLRYVQSLSLVKVLLYLV